MHTDQELEAANAKPEPPVDPVVIGSRWRHRRTKRVAEVVGVTFGIGTKVGYRYEAAVKESRHERRRNKPHVQTCWVDKARFAAAFVPVRSRAARS